MKNILINIPGLNKEYGGIYQYSLALLKILAKGNLEHQFFIFCNTPDDDLISIIATNPKFNFVDLKYKELSKSKRLLYKCVNLFLRLIGSIKRLRKKDLYDSIIEQYHIDIVHTPYQSSVNKANVKVITTMHDVQELHFPEFFTSSQRAERAVKYKRAIDRADAVIVSYDHINRDIKKYFNKPESQIYTVLLDMQDLWFDRIKTRQSEVLDKYNLPSEFLLYPAASWEHKNHLRLIEALKILNHSEINLVCTGHKTEHYADKIEPLIKKLNLTDSVKFLGIVTDEELYELYHNCNAVVVPTLYEAGSFPLMESVLMGIPVICSNATSLPNTLGDDRFVFDPFNVEDIAEKIKSIWFDDEYRKENKTLLDRQAKKLKNNNAAFKINEIYKDITG